MGRRKISLQDVVVSRAGDSDPPGMVVAFLAYRAGAEMGIAADFDGRGGVFDLGAGNKAVAV